ncbi:hypothetical protein PhaeoP10_02904 [Phaeobacter inhibens]|nr:hypothetical protein PhaeoP10_02904 [Phaeobacter inhibens]
MRILRTQSSATTPIEADGLRSVLPLRLFVTFPVGVVYVVFGGRLMLLS